MACVLVRERGFFCNMALGIIGVSVFSMTGLAGYFLSRPAAHYWRNAAAPIRDRREFRDEGVAEGFVAVRDECDARLVQERLICAARPAAAGILISPAGLSPRSGNGGCGPETLAREVGAGIANQQTSGTPPDAGSIATPPMAQVPAVTGARPSVGTLSSRSVPLEHEPKKLPTFWLRSCDKTKI